MSDLILNKDETLPQIVAGRFRNQTDMQGSKSPRNEPQSSNSTKLNLASYGSHSFVD